MMIFDRFGDLREASKFAVAVHETEGLNVCVYTSVDDACTADPFPFELTGPIVHVDRSDEPGIEERIRALVTTFGGSFAGT